MRPAMKRTASNSKEINILLLGKYSRGEEQEGERKKRWLAVKDKGEGWV